MTEEQQRDQAGTAAERRAFPPCECGSRRCGGRPEAGLRLTSPYPPVAAAAGRPAPPTVPYVPRQVGELVLDALSGRLGHFMDRIGKTVYLRPESGGAEWEADPGWIDRPPKGLGTKLSERNRDSRLNSGTTEPV
ncbi:hypothetical protein [Streptomyces sp. CB03911]|uniref:hypothetical protein n=1 Tax=Streptomyces sp. CB03911 TaxID=1804758 RepID=UPI00095E7598|nr:hypothetical protein [Streptomyces sp. CB03911]OKI12052.1 hypothetical protein A6A07_19210 [Streptomyces sp. CB03911]